MSRHENIEYEISNFLISPENAAEDTKDAIDWLLGVALDTDSFVSTLIDKVEEKVIRYGVDSIEIEEKFEHIRGLKEDFKT